MRRAQLRCFLSNQPSKASPYEFECKFSIATPVTHPKGSQFVKHATALHGNPFDGHTLDPVTAALETLTSVETCRIHVEKGYRGRSHPHRFRVRISQSRISNWQKATRLKTV